MRNDNTMLHMKLNAAVSVFSIAAAFSVFLPPSNAYGGICFLPDCNLDGTSFDDVNSDSSWCIDNGYYFTCPEGTAPDYSQTCPRDESYTKCSSEQWCIDNGYTKTAQSCYDLGPTWFPQNLCPKGFDLYKSCVEDTAQACEDKGYVNNCSRPDKTEICEWNSSFTKCCNDTESNGCPENSKVSGCEDGTIVGQDTCGYDCHQCCQTSCPAGYAYTDEETSGGTSGYIKDMANEDDYCLHCTRGKLYKRKENPCTGYDLCSTYGGVDNGDYCYTGNTKKYSKCLTECRPGYIEWCDTPVTDCETLGYTQTTEECANAPAVACPFNKDKWYCNKCSYTYTAETCAANCQNVGTSSCVRNGTTYYASCGSSKCSNGQSCYNGTCYNPVAISGSCCGYTNYCGYTGGTSSSYDSKCRSSFGYSCYEKCKEHGSWPDCNDMQASCQASGGILVFQNCNAFTGGYAMNVNFACQ